MIFAIIGILVLVVSFVIALVTLVREQGRIDEVGVVEPETKGRVDAVAVTKEVPDPLIEHKTEELNPYPEPLKTFDAHIGSSEVLQQADVSSEVVASAAVAGEKPHVWWDRLDEGEESLEEKNEDEKSIEKIREELAKLMSPKTDLASAEDNDTEDDEGLAAVVNLQKPTSGGLAATTLAGEFSMREIKKKN